MTPALSVVMVTPHRYDTCRTTIAYLLTQTVRDQMEIVIVAPSADALEPDESQLQAFGAFQIVPIGPLASNGSSIAAGIRAARAPIVVYGEEHSYPEPVWAERLIARHQEPYAAVGYAMGNANPGTLTSWAHFYGQFGPVIAPVQSATATFLGGHHTSYKRSSLLEYGDALPQMMDNECALHIDLRTSGHELYLENVVSNHVNISQWRAYCLLDYFGQRGFGAARAAAGNWSLARRLVYACAAPLVPIVRARRILRDLSRTGRLGQLAPQIFVIITPALVCGAVGEALGYLVGDAPHNYQTKINFELDRLAYVTPQDSESLRAKQKTPVKP